MNPDSFMHGELASPDFGHGHGHIPVTEDAPAPRAVVDAMPWRVSISPPLRRCTTPGRTARRSYGRSASVCVRCRGSIRAVGGLAEENGLGMLSLFLILLPLPRPLTVTTPLPSHIPTSASVSLIPLLLFLSPKLPVFAHRLLLILSHSAGPSSGFNMKPRPDTAPTTTTRWGLRTSRTPRRSSARGKVKERRSRMTHGRVAGGTIARRRMRRVGHGALNCACWKGGLSPLALGIPSCCDQCSCRRCLSALPHRSETAGARNTRHMRAYS
ncbi:hypothetical protein B0H11DRAFT_543120 [Mycena galericulata]|nr:hypothetical protein B0H11DRAFT_543120 [Mycena galericulata]